jgi:hypothetical protein
VDLPSSTLPQVLKRKMSTGRAALPAAGDGRWEMGDRDGADMKISEFARLGRAKQAADELAGMDCGILELSVFSPGNVAGIQHHVRKRADFAAGSPGEVVELDFFLQMHSLKAFRDVGHCRYGCALNLVAQSKIPGGGKASKKSIG